MNADRNEAPTSPTVFRLIASRSHRPRFFEPANGQTETWLQIEKVIAANIRSSRKAAYGDLYDIEGSGRHRHGWKKLLNALFFSDGPLGNWPEGTREYLPSGIKFRDAIEAVKVKHIGICRLLETPIGYELMRAESDMLVDLLLGFYRMNITVLPLHDALLCADCSGDEVAAGMNATFARHTGDGRGIVSLRKT